MRAPGRELCGESWDAAALAADPALALSYITAVPRMAYYIAYSARIYEIYLQYIAPEDIHVYSIDEVFMDVTPYLATNGLSARANSRKSWCRRCCSRTGITATAGIGSNLYLCKVAMDIVAKHVKPDRNGVRIAALSEGLLPPTAVVPPPAYRFLARRARVCQKAGEVWAVHHGGYRALLARQAGGVLTTRSCSNRLFGVNAELLIDHAWGWEPCTMADIKAYRPAAHSLGAGQVLHEPYPFDKARLVLREMAEQLALDLTRKAPADHAARAHRRVRPAKPRRPHPPRAVHWPGHDRPLRPPRAQTRARHSKAQPTPPPRHSKSSRPHLTCSTASQTPACSCAG